MEISRESALPPLKLPQSLDDLKRLGQDRTRTEEVDVLCQGILAGLPEHSYSLLQGERAFEAVYRDMRLRQHISPRTTTADSIDPGQLVREVPGVELDDFVLTNDDYIVGKIGVVGLNERLVIPIWDAAAKIARLTVLDPITKRQKILALSHSLPHYTAPRIDISVGGHKIIATYRVPGGYVSNSKGVIDVWDEVDVRNDIELAEPSFTVVKKGLSPHGPAITIGNNLLVGFNNETWWGADGYLYVCDLTFQANTVRSVWQRMLTTDAPKEEMHSLTGSVWALEAAGDRVVVASSRRISIFDWKTGKCTQEIMGSSKGIDKVRLVGSILLLGTPERIIGYSLHSDTPIRILQLEIKNSTFEPLGYKLVAFSISGDNLSMYQYDLQKPHRNADTGLLDIENDSDSNVPRQRLELQVVNGRLWVTDGKRIHRITVHENETAAKVQRMQVTIAKQQARSPSFFALSYQYLSQLVRK